MATVDGIMDSHKEPWKKPAIIRRPANTKTVYTIYAEVQSNVKVFRCPFCTIQPFASQIKLRSHLKSEHGEFKTILIDSPKPKIAEPLQYVNLNSSESNCHTILENLVTTHSSSANPISTEMFDGTDMAQRKGTPKRKHADGNFTGLKRSRTEVFEDSILRNDEEEMVNEDDIEVFKDEIDQQLKLMLEPDIRGESIELEFCTICSGSVERKKSSFKEIEVDFGPLRSLIENFLGVKIVDKSLCSLCKNLATEIFETKQELASLQESLNAAISKLRDLFQLGRDLLENDLHDGGFVEEEHIVIKIVQETRPIVRTAKNLGFTVSHCFNGTIVVNDNLEDDGSPVEEVEVGDEEACLFISQEEWASSGLTVNSRRVQIPRELVHGVAFGADRPRFSFSVGVSEEMGDNTYICLDCDKTFPRLGELVEHSELHEDTRLKHEGDEDRLFSNEDSFSQINEPVDFNEQELVQKLDKLKENLEDTGSTRNKLEFKAYIHKEQYKDFINDVPTLEKPFQCQECNKTFASAHELWGHQVSVGSQTFDCNFGDCKEIFLKLPDFAVHYTGHAGHKLVIPLDMKSKKVMNIICPICGTVVTGLYKLQRHKMKHDAELKYKCPACPKQFVKANTLRNHINNIHKGEKAEKACHLCDRVVYSYAGLALHLKNSHGLIQEEFPCAKCGLSFESEQKLREHEEVHKNPEIRVDERGGVEESNPSLRKCGKCDGMFAEPDFLQHNEILIKTGICPKKKSRRKLARQVCPECSLQLGEGETLSHHFKSSHPEESARFQCSECETRLLSLQGCRKHYRLTHRGTPLTCILCKETFSKEYSLHQHLATNHQSILGAPPTPGAPVLCKFCDESFNVFMEMVIHARFTHLVETIDITNTELEEVTMIGGHVVEFAEDGVQIVALHTIP